MTRHISNDYFATCTYVDYYWTFYNRSEQKLKLHYKFIIGYSYFRLWALTTIPIVKSKTNYQTVNNKDTVLTIPDNFRPVISR